MEHNIYLYLLVAAGVTYLIRALPMTLIRKNITNKYIRSFLYYVPYAVLACMTFPSVFSSTGSTVSGVTGCVAAIVLAYCGRGLLTVALGAVAASFVMLLLGF